MLFEGDFYLHLGDQSYDVAPGSRFLMIQQASRPNLIVVTNFLEELKERVGN